MGAHNHGIEVNSIDTEQVRETHYGFLGSYLGSNEKAKDAIFYSYTRYINGFAANLEEEEALEISKHPNVVSVFPNKPKRLHTTRSWEFLGLERSNGRVPSESIWTKAKFGRDVIIGNLDTGVWPESESFRDEGMGPIPSKWKGICQNETKIGVRCNRKLIGARFFSKGYESVAGPLDPLIHSPRDFDGHGTHTLSTAAGRPVPDASIFGYANGTAKGGSPAARVAAYKVCWPSVGEDGGCFDADILAAFDTAIYDGVNVLSTSLGGDHAGDYFADGIAIGAFHAVRHGVTVVCSAGNSGPAASSVTNVAPWIITVGASTIDREFPSVAVLGDHEHIKGQSLSATFLKNNQYPLINSADASKTTNKSDAQICLPNSLDSMKVKGKIVVCLRGQNPRVEKGSVVLQAGGIGMILANDEASGDEVISDAHVLPATHITYADGLKVYTYLNSTRKATGYITHPKTALNTKPAPFMAAFSSQGPNSLNPEILKPDITAPGVSILASYSGAASPSTLNTDTRRSAFAVESGTSMSCPHVAGIVGLLKTLHPNWSPAVIRSAIMTSARTRDNMREPMNNASFAKATPFSYGAGHVRPNRAMDPGLVYDATTEDYLAFLCDNGYNSSQMASFAGSKHYACPKRRSSRLVNMNYPSITVPRLARGHARVVRRVVKNVGGPGTYRAHVQAPVGVSVKVVPEELVFKRVGEEKEFRVFVEAKKGGGGGAGYVFGGLLWTDGVHYVRSPIVVRA
ncbi:Subtilisin-like protease [Acorus gramineus]|uniref:Subtilisin-like protease n=1 Tax=Acorus gramineus TaxID=55184 RepID=A0AAV9B876_ACOGR|nr:Subtilisin-like protease [Acorus gramineus]